VSTIVQLRTKLERRQTRELFWEYLNWVNSRVKEGFGIEFDIRTILEQDMRSLGKFLPPDGRLLLAADEHNAAGLICLRRLDQGIGEIKRMYVRPHERGKGIGNALLSIVIDEARTIGYGRLRLDSARFMNEAHSLYWKLGFVGIGPYPGSEIPKDFQAHWIFMEKIL
jgi:GNAT superfamily N-acetyltransferase